MSLVLSYFRTTSVAHTLKDLEKSLPSAAGISGMLVKDYIAALVADSLLMVEKIGSGNWYWSFPADTKRQKTSMLEQVRKERDKALEQVSAAENAVAVEKERLSDEGEEGGVGLVDRLKEMQALRVKLVGEVEAFADSKGTDVVLDERDRLRLKVNELVGGFVLVLCKCGSDGGRQHLWA